MKKILFIISHPAHYHMFKFLIRELKQKDYPLLVVIRPKDVLEELCVNDKLEYLKLADRPDTGNLLRLAYSLVKKDWDMLQLVKHFRPDLMLGSDGTISRVGALLGIPSVEFSEDDARAIKLYAISSYTFFSHIISPIVTDAWLWSAKKIGYAGFQKLAYLHPAFFQPNHFIKERYIDVATYFIVRLSALNAYHDAGEYGMDTNSFDQLISLLEKHGKVYITSEKKLAPKYESYQLKINPADLHHVLFYSSMLIGDSQSMTVEAALLGVPSFRLSSFVGKLSVLEELEHVYSLTFGFRPNEFNEMLNKIEEVLMKDMYKSVFAQRRLQLLADKINVTAFYLWFIENYPASVEIMRKNPDYQYNFR
jgi:predicted glycosyltransferase